MRFGLLKEPSKPGKITPGCADRKFYCIPDLIGQNCRRTIKNPVFPDLSSSFEIRRISRCDVLFTSVLLDF